MLLAGSLVSACGSIPCRAARAPVSDDEAVSGATGADVLAATGERFDGLPVEWRFGGETLVGGVVDVEAGTGRRVNRPDCVRACLTTYQLSMACGPDELVHVASARVWTDDGRLDGVRFDGTTSATALGGSLGWYFSGELPWAEAQSAFTREELGQDERWEIDAVRVHLYGADSDVQMVSFDFLSHSVQLDAESASALGAPPDDDE